MLSKRPYLVPAFYDWIVDQGHVPHLVVNAEADGVMVPTAFVEDGHIQLNIGPSAVRDFHMDRSGISFEARFAGQPERIHVPMHAILAIVDRDSGQGATFPDEPGETFPEGEGAATPPPAGKPERKGAPHLRAVPDSGAENPAGEETASGGSSRSGKSSDEDPDDDPPPGGGGGKGGPSLRVIK